MSWNVLIACEETQRTCNEFLKLGVNAYSAKAFAEQYTRPFTWLEQCNLF